jgi:four helix bundle protein
VKLIKTHNDLDVYKLSFESAMEIYKISKSFPKEETYSMIDQIRRSSRSVATNIAEAFRKRRYPKHFVSKLSDSEGEAAETQVWLDFALSCNYINEPVYEKIYQKYDWILGKIVNMIKYPEKWKQL